MTRDEFDSWLEVHTACFPGVDDWLRKMPGHKQVGTLTEWFRVLQRTPLDDATRASRAIYDDGNLEPRGFGKHPIAVRNLAAKYRWHRDRVKSQVDAPAKKMTPAEREAAREMIQEIRDGLASGLEVPF